MVADDNREDMTHVKIENISFNNSIIIYTEGLVTLYGCTLHKPTRFFMYKSQYEPDFIYKTAEMIPSVIRNKTINIIIQVSVIIYSCISCQESELSTL